MSKLEKLREKLDNGTISASDLRTLLKKEGFSLDRTRGSHEVWIKGHKTLILATHGNSLKPYQIKEAREALK